MPDPKPDLAEAQAEVVSLIMEGFSRQIREANATIEYLGKLNATLRAERDEAIRQRDEIADTPMNEWGVQVWEHPGQPLICYRAASREQLEVQGAVALIDLFSFGSAEAMLMPEQARIERLARDAGRMLGAEIAKRIAPDLWRLFRAHQERGDRQRTVDTAVLGGNSLPSLKGSRS